MDSVVDWLLKQRIASAIYVQATHEARVKYEKMISHLATVINKTILHTKKKDAVPANTKKGTKFGLAVSAGRILRLLTLNLSMKQIKKFLFTNAN